MINTTIVNFSDIAKHPSNRMDAGYWVGKSKGKKAYKKVENGKVAENDKSGTIMLPEEDATKLNSLIDQRIDIEKQIENII